MAPVLLDGLESRPLARCLGALSTHLVMESDGTLWCQVSAGGVQSSHISRETDGAENLVKD